MADPLEHAGSWQERLDALVAGSPLPGAVLGVSWEGRRVMLCSGVANLDTGLPVIAATAFQFGSISKLYTATLLARLGGLSTEGLASPVAELVPEAAWMDPTIRVEHLLTHTSGLGGDHFADTGSDAGALARYVAELEALPPDVPGPPGERYSYCNSGYVVLGRLAEALSGHPFPEALRSGLLQPLGAVATTTRAEDTILGAVAVGHNRFDEGPMKVDPVWNFPRACDPLGGISGPVGDLLAFAELHLADGVAPGGERLLEADLVRSMRARRVECPPLGRPDARGLGWGLFDTWRGATLAGHDGETLGQIAKLRLLPERDLAVVVLTNGIPDGNVVTRALEAEVLGAWGLKPRPRPAPLPVAGFDPTPYLGRYANLQGTVEITAAPRGLELTKDVDAVGLPARRETAQLVPIGPDVFVEADDPDWLSVTRFGDPEPGPARAGRRRSRFSGGRLAWRIEDGVGE